MKYFFTEKALKDIKKLSQHTQKRIVKKLDFFASQKDLIRFSEPLINSALGQYRFRIGDYRIIFDLEIEDVIILRIGHRKSIYR
ncbi:type II toxin-antitoxin system RelE/ParE family toxin [candidate division WWE3 bacterium]|nr:type II toxin-antitoxin system RelE/ParE family toxin [candidate division WWE3 bacterium]